MRCVTGGARPKRTPSRASEPLATPRKTGSAWERSRELSTGISPSCLRPGRLPRRRRHCGQPNVIGCTSTVGSIRAPMRSTQGWSRFTWSPPGSPSSGTTTSRVWRSSSGTRFGPTPPGPQARNFHAKPAMRSRNAAHPPASASASEASSIPATSTTIGKSAYRTAIDGDRGLDDLINGKHGPDRNRQRTVENHLGIYEDILIDRNLELDGGGTEAVETRHPLLQAPSPKGRGVPADIGDPA